MGTELEIFRRINLEIVASVLATDFRSINFRDGDDYYSVTVCNGVPVPSRIFLAMIFRYFTEQGSVTPREWGTGESNYQEIMFLFSNCVVPKTETPYSVICRAISTLYQNAAAEIPDSSAFMKFMAGLDLEWSGGLVDAYDVTIPADLPTFRL